MSDLFVEHWHSVMLITWEVTALGGSWRVLQQLNPAEFMMEPEMTFKLRYKERQLYSYV